MTKVAIYPGSFNPWHDGHDDVLQKALKVFDKVIIAQGINPDKKFHEYQIPSAKTYGKYGNKVQCAKFKGLLVNFINSNPKFQISAVIRGLRNGQDFEFEKTQQYWNEDLGLVVPTIYLVSDRSLVHVSSSAIRMVESITARTSSGENSSD